MVSHSHLGVAQQKPLQCSPFCVYKIYGEILTQNPSLLSGIPSSILRVLLFLVAISNSHSLMGLGVNLGFFTT